MRRLETTALFVLLFIAYLIAGSVIMHKAEYVSDEVNIRSGMAADLLDGNERGRQGLICSVFWAPLPTLLLLPFAISSALISSGLACVILSAAGGALACVFMFKALKRFEVPRAILYPIIALVAFNPWMLLISSTGSSEALVLGLLSGTMWSFVLWHYDEKLSGLVGLSLMAALLPLVEHQAIIFSLLIILSATAVSFFRGKPDIRKTEGTFFLAASPTVYSVGLWFLFNWLIMGNPAYFLQGAYVNRVVPEPTSEMAGVQGMLGGFSMSPGALKAASPFLVEFFVAPFMAVAVLFLALSFVKKRNWHLVLLLALLAAMPLYHLAMSTHDQSFGVAEDMAAAIPICVFAAGYFLYTMFRKKPAGMYAGSFLVLVLIGIGTLGSHHYVQENVVSTPFVESESFPYVSVREKGNEKEILDYILSQESLDSRIALMGFQGYDFIKRVDGGEEFVHTINVNIPLIDYRTKGKSLWLLIPKPSGVGAFDSVNLAYRGLYDAGQRDIITGNVRFNLMLDGPEFPDYHIIAVTRIREDRDIFLEKIPEDTGISMESRSPEADPNAGS